jgi:hypothetical protein
MLPQPVSKAKVMGSVNQSLNMLNFPVGGL